ncbi:MAG TPA: hypothetical protein VK578_24490 [Edaphobacter sp.]|nr:hypothetical protein [Edaphobacter sp.]
MPMLPELADGTGSVTGPPGSPVRVTVLDWKRLLSEFSGWAVTVVVKVTDWPADEGLRELCRVVMVGRVVMVSVRVADAGAWVASPL